MQRIITSFGFLSAACLAVACSTDNGEGPGSAGGSGGVLPGNGGSSASGGTTTASGGTAPSSGGASGGAQASGGTGPGSGGTTPGSGGTTPGSGGAISGSGGAPPAPGACGVTTERARITEVDVGITVTNNEDEAALMPLSISPVPSGGSRVAFMSTDGKVHVVTLDASDAKTGSDVAFPAHDFSDLYADDTGGVLLLTRDAKGGGILNCGQPTNLCGTPPSPPIACHGLSLVPPD